MDSKIIKKKNDQKTIKNHDQNSKKYGGLCQKAPETNAERSPLTVGTQQGQPTKNAGILLLTGRWQKKEKYAVAAKNSRALLLHTAVPKFLQEFLGRVQILVWPPKLNNKKNGQGTVLCFIHVWYSEIGQSTDTSFDCNTQQNKIARVPPCVSYISLAQKSGRVHVDAGSPELTGCLLKKNVQCPAVPAPKGTVAVWAAGPLDIYIR